MLEDSYITYMYRSQATPTATKTGCRGLYSLMKLPHHDRVQKTMPDAMHTVKYVVEVIVDLVVGRCNTKRIVSVEVAREQFYLSAGDRGGVPFQLSPEDLKLATKPSQALHTSISIRPGFHQAFHNEVTWLESGNNSIAFLCQSILTKNYYIQIATQGVLK